jgi:hypothetical protein
MRRKTSRRRNLFSFFSFCYRVFSAQRFLHGGGGGKGDSEKTEGNEVSSVSPANQWLTCERESKPEEAQSVVTAQ